ncbi:MAG: BatD family protein [Gammaproteobacteria bacterium]|nr:BatD family protein [Gammaproteobacteria bacterium]
MKPTGRGLRAPLLLLLVWMCSSALAEVTAIVDRNTLQLGDSFRLIITVTEDEELSTLDLTPLQADFDILQRSTNSQTNIVNGRRSHTKQLHIDLAPRVEGSLQIPSLNVDGTFTRPITLRVTPAADMGSADQPLVFEAEVDKQAVYVQGQLLLTVRIKQAINLDNRTISELELDNAFVKPLEQVSFQRTINGRNWLVHEIRYAIFPEQSGVLEIPSQVFTAREVVARRSLFDLGGTGARLRRATDPIRIDVLARPRHFPASTWLPASSLTIEEEWSTPPEQLKVGESATRTIRLRGEGLQGAQLPPTLFTPGDGVKYYPDQPQIDELENASGLVGVREDSAALVPTRAGLLVLPEIRLPWWDTANNRVRYATLPERTIDVGAGSLNLPPVLPTNETAPVAARAPGTSQTATQAISAGTSGWWQLSTVAALLGWLATVAFFLYGRRGTTATSSSTPDDPNETACFNALLSACKNNDPLAARNALRAWLLCAQPAQAASNNRPPTLDLELQDETLRSLCAELDASVFGKQPTPWSGAALAQALGAYRSRQKKNRKAGANTLTLYPAA